MLSHPASHVFAAKASVGHKGALLLQPDCKRVNSPAHASDLPHSPMPQVALRWALRQLESPGNESHVRDARILLRHVLGCTEEALIVRMRALTPEQGTSFQKLVSRRSQGEPIAYITGKKEFMGLEFAVDRRVLIPRPETELLVERALELWGCNLATVPSSPPMVNDTPHPTFADVGTGSGVIAVSIARHLPLAKIYATDISADALAVARKNALAHGVANRLVFLQGDLLRALSEPVHVIVCNPPYIPLGEVPGLDPDVRDYEPHLALAGGADGVAAYRDILADLPHYLLPGGCVLFEIGFDQAAVLWALAARHLPGARVDVYQDLAGFDRVMQISQVVPADPEG